MLWGWWSVLNLIILSFSWTKIWCCAPHNIAKCIIPISKKNAHTFVDMIWNQNIMIMLIIVKKTEIKTLNMYWKKIEEVSSSGQGRLATTWWILSRWSFDNILFWQHVYFFSLSKNVYFSFSLNAFFLSHKCNFFSLTNMYFSIAKCVFFLPLNVHFSFSKNLYFFSLTKYSVNYDEDNIKLQRCMVF